MPVNKAVCKQPQVHDACLYVLTKYSPALAFCSELAPLKSQSDLRNQSHIGVKV